MKLPELIMIWVEQVAPALPQTIVEPQMTYAISAIGAHKIESFSQIPIMREVGSTEVCL